MYIFKANYINMNTYKSVAKNIEIDDCTGSFDTEKEIYIQAMSQAYDMINYDELFDSLEFIGC